MSMKSFPRPSDLPVPAGAEGWEQIYPYYLVFQDELRELEDEKFWFCDSQHWPTVFKPFETIGGEFAVKCLGQYNARHLMIPNANGIDFRIHLGYLYMSPIPVPEEDIPARVPEFQARIGHYFTHWDTLLDQWKTKVRGTIDELESLEFDPLPAIVPMDDIIAGTAMDGSQKLMDNYDRLIQLAYQNWQYHFEFLNLGYIAYLDFFNFCKEIFPDIPDQSIAVMVQGVDMELFRPDDELKQLAALAVEMGLQEHFANTDDPTAVLEALRAAGAQRWLDRWEEAQDPWFNFTTGNGFYAHDRYWKEHLEIPLGFISDYIRRLDDGQQIMRPTEELISEKERIVEEYRELLDGDQLAQFDAKRQLAAKAYPYVENHNFYIEHWTMGVFWRKVRELDRTLVHHGVFAEEGDLLYLNRNEVRDAIFDLVTAWGVGAPQGPIAPAYWPRIIAERKQIVSALKTARPQPALNTPPEAITEPFTRMLWGITTEQVQSWLSDDDGESGLKGMAASPGVVEGIARVVMDAEQIHEVQQDEILVAPVTAPSWGPIFGKLKATVTDIGGMMSHAAIVCREYALPAVTGTGNASTTIRTGQRLRVDGTRGVVEILDDVDLGPGAHSHAHGEQPEPIPAEPTS